MKDATLPVKPKQMVEYFLNNDIEKFYDTLGENLSWFPFPYETILYIIDQIIIKMQQGKYWRSQWIELGMLCIDLDQISTAYNIFTQLLNTLTTPDGFNMELLLDIQPLDLHPVDNETYKIQNWEIESVYHYCKYRGGMHPQAHKRYKELYIQLKNMDNEDRAKIPINIQSRLIAFYGQICEYEGFIEKAVNLFFEALKLDSYNGHAKDGLRRLLKSRQ